MTENVDGGLNFDCWWKREAGRSGGRGNKESVAPFMSDMLVYDFLYLRDGIKGEVTAQIKRNTLKDERSETKKCQNGVIRLGISFDYVWPQNGGESTTKSPNKNGDKNHYLNILKKLCSQTRADNLGRREEPSNEGTVSSHLQMKHFFVSVSSSLPLLNTQISNKNSNFYTKND